MSASGSLGSPVPQTLDAAAADAFEPPLTSTDALVESITFEAVSATGS